MDVPMFSTHTLEYRDGVPSLRQAAEIAGRLLDPTRLAHVRRAGMVAASLPLPISPHERRLLIAAASLHDIGYSSQLRRSGFHSLDGGWYLKERGFDGRLAILVANHSHAWLQCPDPWLGELAVDFPRERSLIADALVFADMSSAPDGAAINLADRLVEISARHPSPYLSLRLRIRESVARVVAHMHGPAAGHELPVADPAERSARPGLTREGR